MFILMAFRQCKIPKHLHNYQNKVKLCSRLILVQIIFIICDKYIYCSTRLQKELEVVCIKACYTKR